MYYLHALSLLERLVLDLDQASEKCNSINKFKQKLNVNQQTNINCSDANGWFVCLGAGPKGSVYQRLINAWIVAASLLGFTNFKHMWYINFKSYNAFKQDLFSKPSDLSRIWETFCNVNLFVLLVTVCIYFVVPIQSLLWHKWW